MVRCLVLLLCLVVVSANPPVKKIQKCSKAIIDKIHLYWAGAGTPKGVIELQGQYSAYKSTNAELFHGIKCRTYCFPPGGKMSTTIDGVEKTEDAKEKDGLVTVAGRKSYVILAECGVMAVYNCSDDDDAPAFDPNDPEDGTILVKPNADKDTLAHAQGVLKMLGFHLDMNYECN